MDTLLSINSSFKWDPILIVGASVAAALVLRMLYQLHLAPLFSPLRHIPKPNQGFVWFRLLHEPPVPEIEEWIDTLPHNGLIRYYGLFNRERLFIASPEAAKDLLSTSVYKFIKPELQRALVYNISGHGLLILEGSEHKEARKQTSPAFAPAQLKKKFPEMWQTTVKMLDTFPVVNESSAPAPAAKESETTKDGLTSLSKLIHAASLDMIGHFGFGTSFHTLSKIGQPKAKSSTVHGEPKERFGQTYIKMWKTTKKGQLTLKAASFVGAHLALALPIPAVKTIHGIMGLARKTAESIVSDREKSVQDSKDQASKQPDDLLDQLLKSGHFSHQDLVEETIHFFAAGTETVTGTALWAFHLLSRHLDWQTRIRDEVRSNIPSPDEFLNDGAPELKMRNMTYLKAFVEEVLRYHSINTLLWRECNEPAQLAGYDVPKGTAVVYSPWTMNRDPKLWGPDARTFRPERWLDVSNDNSRHSYSLLTFGGGPRRCLGEQYARDQLHCLIAGLIGRFEFRPLSDNGTDEGREIGDNFALTLFKIYEGWNLRYRQIPGW
ncbi:pisatin demethylase / cytochrome P450 monooxygenase [Venturia nashicola]|uniref:Pisatin demethylase / cytochrome P450 monooxygenase n=1 Tax=Venturia nashicola TaxID=86259 RepID=A0A4Z1NN88_9PEZI|nr:pisatin demethylase / cytochrome P450 monooxygenase [Venturia nashicola]TLD20093.1 pisatin demethylase / cytochrome P450 monooxygenase [Venturia nashicola]